MPLGSEGRRETGCALFPNPEEERTAGLVKACGALLACVAV